MIMTFKDNTGKQVLKEASLRVSAFHISAYPLYWLTPFDVELINLA